jgi:outer membrane biosynthesis protein TonB
LFRAATASEVQRFAMQRRVFQVAGVDMLAVRSDGFFETAGTVEPLIEAGMPAVRARAAMPKPSPEPVAAEAAPEPEMAEPTPEPDMAEPLAAEPMPAAVPRQKRPRKPKAAPVFFAPEPEPEDEPELAQPAQRPLPLLDHKPRVREDRTPRWLTAGAERRGRAGQHWSARTK